ncbi:unannotated protein [freshwater metagenome]|uniref:Unannotated protein n=1 Tax=freshwater metagenome TaxID=449393 RepID=A0A6J7DQE8_9ZZZZ
MGWVVTRQDVSDNHIGLVKCTSGRSSQRVRDRRAKSIKLNGLNRVVDLRQRQATFRELGGNGGTSRGQNLGVAAVFKTCSVDNWVGVSGVSVNGDRDRDHAAGVLSQVRGSGAAHFVIKNNVGAAEATARSGHVGQPRGDGVTDDEALRSSGRSTVGDGQVIVDG